MNKKQLSRKLVWSLLFLLIFTVGINTPRAVLEFNIAGNNKEGNQLTVFYDNDSVEYPFDDEHMYSNIAEISESAQKITVQLSKTEADKIRIDFGEAPGKFVLDSLRVVTPKSIYTFSASDVLNNFNEKNDVEKAEIISEDAVKITTIGNDGYLASTNIFLNVHSKINVVGLLGTIGFSIVVVGIVASLLKLKKKLSQINFKSKISLLRKSVSLKKNVNSFALMLISSLVLSFLIERIVVIFAKIVLLSERINFEEIDFKNLWSAWNENSIEWSFVRFLVYFTLIIGVMAVRHYYKKDDIYKYYLYCMLVSAIIFCCIYQPLALADRMYMYVDIGADTYCSYFPTILYDKNLLNDFSKWSFSLGLGGTTVNYAQLCYILDPLSWPMLLFDRDSIDIGIFISLLIKNICLWNFSFLYLKKRGLRKTPLLISAIIYSFCGWMIGWGQHYSFATAFVLFTVILYFFEKWLVEKKWVGYVLTLTLLLVVLPYYGYMTLLFLALYYLFRYFTIEKGITIKKFLIHGGKTAGLCFLAMGIAAVVFLPVCMQMLSSPRIGGNVSLSFVLGNVEEYLTMLSRMLSNNVLGTSYYDGTRNFYEAPFLFVSILSIYLIPAICKTENKKKSVLAGALILASLMFINISCIVFNAFSAFTYRWTFVLVPLIALNTGYGLSYFSEHIVTPKMKWYCTASFIIIDIFLLSGYFIFWKEGNLNNNASILSVSVVLLANIAYWVIFISSDVLKRRTLNFLLIIVAMEMTLNGYITVNIRNTVTDQHREILPLFDATTEKAIDILETNNTDFYRVYKKYDTAELDDPLANDYYGETLYSSSFSEPYYDLKSIFKLPDKGTNYFWGFNDRQALRDISGSKYMLSKEKQKYYGYEYTETVDEVFVYENMNMIPFGMFYEEYMLRSQFEQMDDLEKQDFLYQACVIEEESREIKNCLEKNIYVSPKVMNNVEYEVKEEGEEYVLKLGERNSKPIVIMLDNDTGTSFSGFLYTSGKNRLNSGIEFNVTAKSTGYYMLNQLDIENIYIYFDNTNNDQRNDLKNLMKKIQIFEKDMSENEQYIEKHQRKVLDILEFEDDYIRGNVVAKSSGMLSVPILYDEGWGVLVDGQEQKIYKTNIGFLGTLLYEGEHEVVFYYKVPGMKTGMYTTFGALGVFLLLMFVEKRKRKFINHLSV